MCYELCIEHPMLTWRGSWDVGRTACSRHSRLQPKPGCVKQACPQPTKHREAGFVGMPMAQLQESLRCSYCDFAVGLKLSSSENGSNTCENVDDGKSTCPIAYVLVCSAQPIYPARWLYDLFCLFHLSVQPCNHESMQSPCCPATGATFKRQSPQKTGEGCNQHLGQLGLLLPACHFSSPLPSPHVAICNING